MHQLLPVLDPPTTAYVQTQPSDQLHRLMLIVLCLSPTINNGNNSSIAYYDHHLTN